MVNKKLTVTTSNSNVYKLLGTGKHFIVRSRLDTEVELEYYRHGGIL